VQDYGTAWATKAGGVTIPAPARSELGLPEQSHWHVMGSPELGLAILIGPRRSAEETLRFLLDGPSATFEKPSKD
jgi:bifunctional DNA-binding transcriptional regulator/antitoxin component of YhaV-PrlF toxin-antitoxin module